MGRKVSFCKSYWTSVYVALTKDKTTSHTGASYHNYFILPFNRFFDGNNFFSGALFRRKWLFWCWITTVFLCWFWRTNTWKNNSSLGIHYSSSAADSTDWLPGGWIGMCGLKGLFQSLPYLWLTIIFINCPSRLLFEPVPINGNKFWQCIEFET